MEANGTSTRYSASSHGHANGDSAAVTNRSHPKLATSSPSPRASTPTSTSKSASTPKHVLAGTTAGAAAAPAHPEAQLDEEADNHALISSSPITSPPYWVHSHSRSFSNVSVESMRAGGITLQDNTDEGDGDGSGGGGGGGDYTKNKACWAKSVYIEDHVVINGSRTGIGSFVVWNITVETLHGGSMRIRKRYSEFDELHERLLQTFPNSTAAMPPLPPKSVISKFRPNFLEHRRAGLQYFLNCILLNPEFSGSPVLKEFLFS